jgi:hypothetical protein
MKEAITYSEKFEQTLREVDQFVAQRVESEYEDSFNLGSALLFAVDYVRGEVPAIQKVAQHEDIYMMLEDISNAVKLWNIGYNGFAVVTTGWAAPIRGDDDEDEIAPSKHPERRRVRLMSMSHSGKMGSSIRFTDEESVTYDEGNAKGSLASAMEDLHEIVQAMWKSSPKENERQLP